MYGGSGKLGRGGGGGGRGVKRMHSSSFPPPPPSRASGPVGSRLSLGGSGGPRNRPTNSGSAASAPPAVEETFSLVAGNNPRAFAMFIRLVPDLVDEIKRLEAQGGTARIKLDSSGNNTSGNVIDVGGKDFSFKWSSETDDLCDIYEEQQSGENGNGLLVESGCPWRKLNVVRILDESTTNHVKMRSEEAERKLKSRKAIVLDHGNPTVKSHAKQLAAAEANAWRFKQKKEPFKKRKIETPQVTVGGPHKPAGHRSGLSSATFAMGRNSASPLPSPPEQSGAPASPLGIENLAKSHARVENVAPIQLTIKENSGSAEKEFPSKPVSVARGTPGFKGNVGATPMDLQSMLITLLMENPKGMSLKALEKAIGDTIPNSVRKIEPIIKKIATFQAPGRYFLKPGVELESFKKPSSESGSSPEEHQIPPEERQTSAPVEHQTLAPEHNHDQIPALEPNLAEKDLTKEFQVQAELDSKLEEESNASDKVDIEQLSPDQFGNKKVSDNTEGKPGSSSDSGSDSDSESDSSDSGSGSGSHSRSRSRSPVRSGSGSSSDSESDASSNSKEVSDEDVDIMTSDDNKEPMHKVEASQPGLPDLPIAWRIPDDRPVQNGIDEKQDGHESDTAEIGKNVTAEIEKNVTAVDGQETEMDVVTKLTLNKEGEKPVGDEPLERQNYAGDFLNERENMGKDASRHEQSDSYNKISKGKSKRGNDVKKSEEKSERTKRLKVNSSFQPPTTGGRDAQLSEGLHSSSPEKSIEDPHKGSNFQMTSSAGRDGNVGFGSQKGHNQTVSEKYSSDFQQSGRMSGDHGGRSKFSDTEERPGKHAETIGRGFKNSERSFSAHEGSMQKDKAYRETQDESYANGKKMPKNIKEGGVGGKHSMPFERKHGEQNGKFKEAGQVLNAHSGSSSKDNNINGIDRSPVTNSRGSILRRELSDLELGELREPVPEETSGAKKQFERKSSFKQSESKLNISGNWNSDLGKGRAAGKATLDSGKPSPPNLNGAGILSNPDSSTKRRTPEHYVEDFTRPQHRAVQSHSQHLPRIDHAEVGSHFNKFADVSGKSRQKEAGTSQDIGVEGYGETHKKAPVSATQHDSRRGLVPHPTKESRTLLSNTVADLADGRKDASLSEGNNGVRKRREPSVDENDSSYSKYEKDAPELKGPINDFSQYKEYVQEYRDKYDSYCSLNKILEAYRNDFQKMGDDLEAAKGRDTERYNNILRQLKDSYRQCGARHKRLKKIFIVLHEEINSLKQRIKDFAVSYAKD